MPQEISQPSCKLARLGWSRAAAAQRSTATCCPHRKARLWTYLWERGHTHVNTENEFKPHIFSYLMHMQEKIYLQDYKLYSSWAEDWTPSRSSSAGTPSTNKPGKKEENQCMEAELKCKLILTFSFLITSLPRRISWWQSFFLTNLGHSSSLWPNDPWPGRHQKQSHWKTQIIM